MGDDTAAPRNGEFLREFGGATTRLLNEEKLALFLDIDNTILHAIITYDIPYALFTHSATKDMFVFQMETPKAQAPPATSTVHSHHVHPHHALSPIQSEPSPHHLPSKLIFSQPTYELPTKLDHSTDCIHAPSSSHSSTPSSEAETAGPDSSSSSSDDSDPPFSTTSSQSRTGSIELGSDNSSNTDSTLIAVKLKGSKSPSRSRDAPKGLKRSETPEISRLEEADQDEFANKPLYCLVKPRPGAISFLRSARHFFKIFICTFGSLEYATEIRNRLNAIVAKGDKERLPPAIEPQIIAREAHRRVLSPELGEQTQQEDHQLVDSSSLVSVAQTMRKNLKTIVKSLNMDIDERMCVCLDDRLDVWTAEDAEKSVLKIHPYSFFFSHPIYELQAAEHGLHRLAAPPPKLNLDLTSLNDEALRAAWMTLSNIHRKFFHRLNSHRANSPSIVSSTAPTVETRSAGQTDPAPSAGQSTTSNTSPENTTAPVAAVQPITPRQGASGGSKVPPKFDVLPNAFLPSTHAYIAAYRLPVLRGVVITHQGRLVRDILLLASYFGAEILDSFDTRATHFLVSSTDPKTCKDVRKRMKTDKSFAENMFILTCSWITDCARDGCKVSETPYLLVNRFP